MIITAVLMLSLAQSAFAGEGESSGESQGGRGGHGGPGGGMMAENDEEIQAALARQHGKRWRKTSVYSMFTNKHCKLSYDRIFE